MHTVAGQKGPHSISTLLAEFEVVIGTAFGIGMAFYCKFGFQQLFGLQGLRQVAQRLLAFGFDFG